MSNIDTPAAETPKSENPWSTEMLGSWRKWGPLVFFLCLLVFTTFYLYHSPETRTQYCSFIVLITVFATIVYTFIFLIAPEFADGRGIRPERVWLLAVALSFAFVASAVLISIYADRTFLMKGDADLNIVLVFRKLSAPFFESSTISTLVNGLIETHFILFIVIFSWIDLIFWHAAMELADRKKFKRIVIAIDLPVFLAACITLATKHFLDNSPLLEHGLIQPSEIFQAGAISFQFTTGILAAYLLEFS